MNASALTQIAQDQIAESRLRSEWLLAELALERGR